MNAGFEWVVQQIGARLDHIRASAEREKEMIARSHLLLAKAEELLAMPPMWSGICRVSWRPKVITFTIFPPRLLY